MSFLWWFQNPKLLFPIMYSVFNTVSLNTPTLIWQFEKQSWCRKFNVMFGISVKNHYGIISLFTKRKKRCKKHRSVLWRCLILKSAPLIWYINSLICIFLMAELLILFQNDKPSLLLSNEVFFLPLNVVSTEELIIWHFDAQIWYDTKNLKPCS